MKTHAYLLALWLVSASSTSQAAELPVVFARSGQKIAVSVGDDHRKALGGAVLWAYGHAWGKPVKEKDGAVEFTAPEVRVPVVFQVVSVNGEAAGRINPQLIIYPERRIDPDEKSLWTWDKHTQLAAVGTPVWFDTWAKAMGLPLQKLKNRKTFDAGNWRMSEEPGLLVVGREAAGIGPATACRLVGEHKINVLVLDADWFRNNNTFRKIAILPKHTAGALADLQTQQWALPPVFCQHVVRILNRQTWLAGPEHPLVEELRSPEKGVESLRTVFSYLPWPEQLGRSEMADQLLLRLLKETAKGADKRSPLDGRWFLLYPAAKEIKADERPVLAAAMKSAATDVGAETESRKIRAYVLDLRGKTAPPSDLFDGTGAMKAIEARIGVQSPLLILGDNPILDTWKWLELDRPNHRSPRPGVLWCSDSPLPPSTDSQLRLMQLFTEWNIPLDDIPQE